MDQFMVYIMDWAFLMWGWRDSWAEVRGITRCCCFTLRDHRWRRWSDQNWLKICIARSLIFNMKQLPLKTWKWINKKIYECNIIFWGRIMSWGFGSVVWDIMVDLKTKQSRKKKSSSSGSRMGNVCREAGFWRIWLVVLAKLWMSLAACNSTYFAL